MGYSPSTTTAASLPDLDRGEDVLGTIRTAMGVFVGTTRRLLRFRPEAVDEWRYEDIEGIYPLGGSGVFVLAAPTAGEQLPIVLADGPDREDGVQLLTVVALLAARAHRSSGVEGGARPDHGGTRAGSVRPRDDRTG